MKLVMAMVRPGRVDALRQALAAVHVTRMSVADAQGFDESTGGIVQEAVLEVAVNDDFLSRTVDSIAALSTRSLDARGDAIYVLPVEDAVQIYREVRGPEAM
ncbi:MAG: P-II family nitrogen regulator [Planctomycetota bacterium]|nr:P-II family nitrogen regulator [Planctomycetota bacterium]